MGEGLDEELLETSPVHRWKRNEKKALTEARRLVVSHYKLGSQATSEQILNDSEEHDLPESGFEGGRDGEEQFESGGMMMMLNDEDEKGEIVYL
jgi:hypothetical protein